MAGFDKVLHLIVSFAICAGIYAFTKSLGLAVCVTLLVGGIKEIYQVQKGQHSMKEAWMDMAANAAGVAAVAIAVLGMGW
jgi:hypothetical protein